MTQPKTQAELQARVLEVLRREWPDVRYQFGNYWLYGDVDKARSRLRFDGVFRTPSAYLFSLELDALAEASRLLRDGVAAPSRVDRALEALRVEFPDACIDRRPYNKGTEPPPPQLSLTLGLALRHVGGAYESHAWYVINTTTAQHRAIASALEILNGGGE